MRRRDPHGAGFLKNKTPIFYNFYLFIIFIILSFLLFSHLCYFIIIIILLFLLTLAGGCAMPSDRAM